MQQESMIVRLIVNKMATLSEIESHYDLDDLLFMTACLDVRDELEAID